MGKTSAISPFQASVFAGVSLLLVLGLSSYTYELRKQNATQALDSTNLAALLVENLELQSRIGASLAPAVGRGPADLTELPATAAGYLVMAYNPTICQICLRDGLAKLQEEASTLRRAGYEVLILVGDSGEGTRAYTLRLREEGLLTSPFRYVPTSILGAALPFERRGEFLQTPIYLRTDRDLNIAALFRPGPADAAYLDSWLSSVYTGADAHANESRDASDS